jgi:hypothetical protein
LDEAIESNWSRRAAAEISSARADTPFVKLDQLVIEVLARNDRARWWTFGGLKANASLAAMLRTKDGVVPRFDNYFVDIPRTTRASEVEEQLKGIVSTPYPNGIGDIYPPARIKFWDCLPVDLQAQFTESRFTDVDTARMILSEPRLHLEGASSRKCDTTT